MTADVDVGFSDESLSSAAFFRFRLIHVNDEVLQRVGNEESQTGIVDEELRGINFQRTDVASYQR